MTTSIYDNEQNVKEIQMALRNLNSTVSTIPLISPDGFFGPETRIAVELAQEFFGVPKTGIVDFETWTLLFEDFVNL